MMISWFAWKFRLFHKSSSLDNFLTFFHSASLCFELNSLNDNSSTADKWNRILERRKRRVAEMATLSWRKIFARRKNAVIVKWLQSIIEYTKDNEFDSMPFEERFSCDSMSFSTTEAIPWLVLSKTTWESLMSDSTADANQSRLLKSIIVTLYIIADEKISIIFFYQIRWLSRNLFPGNPTGYLVPPTKTWNRTGGLKSKRYQHWSGIIHVSLWALPFLQFPLHLRWFHQGLRDQNCSG